MAAFPIGRFCPDGVPVRNIRQLPLAGNETSAKRLARILVAGAERSRRLRGLGADRPRIRATNGEVLRGQGVTGTLVRRMRGDARPNGAPHPGFGQGLHNRLGLDRARLEAGIAFGATLDRFAFLTQAASSRPPAATGRCRRAGRIRW